MSLLGWFRQMAPAESDTEMERRLVTSVSSSVLDSIVDTQSAMKILAVTVTTEFVAIAMFYVSKDKVQEFLADSDNNAAIYGSIGIFLIGFLTAFAAYRMIGDSLPYSIPKFTVWPVSIAAGIANLALFVLLISFQLK